MEEEEGGREMQEEGETDRKRRVKEGRKGGRDGLDGGAERMEGAKRAIDKVLGGR